MTSWSPTAAPAAPARGGTARGGAHRRAAGRGRRRLALSLYLDPELLERLASADPLVQLHAANVADYWTALEGVSHFLYLAWNAGHDKPVSLLELEMQAEVDKYVVSYWLMRRQFPGRFPAELRRALFERTRIDPRLSAPARRPVSRGEPLRRAFLPAAGVATESGAGVRSARAEAKCWPSCAASIA